MSTSFGSLWDDVPAPLTSTAQLSKADIDLDAARAANARCNDPDNPNLDADMALVADAIDAGYTPEELASKTAAKPKGNRAPEEPTRQPMRPVTQIRNSPSADQLKARKQMSRKQAAETQDEFCGETPDHPAHYWSRDDDLSKPNDLHCPGHPPRKESAMRTEAQILTEMATASLADQRTLAQELDTLRTERTASARADREVDLADTVIRSHLTPVAVHTMHTAATDWFGEDEAHEDPTLTMKTEATLWFQRTSAEVREDIEEFAIQAQGKATQLASRCGEQADKAFEAFIGHVDHLYRTAAKIAGDTIDKDKINGNAESGLPDEVDNDDTAFDDPGFLSDDDDTGVHPKMPGAEGSSKMAKCADCGDPDERTGHMGCPYPQDRDDSKTSRRHTATNDAEDSQASSEKDSFYEGQSEGDEDDGDADDGFGGKKAPPFGSEDGGKTSTKTAGRGDKYQGTCDQCGAKGDVWQDRDAMGEVEFLCDKHTDPSLTRRSTKTADATPDFADGDAKDNLGKPDDTTPLLAEDWDHQSEDPETGKDAADVKDVPTPGGDSGYPKPKTSMLDKAAAFRALVTANLER